MFRLKFNLYIYKEILAKNMFSQKRNNEIQSVFVSSQTVQIDVRIDPHKAVLLETIV